MQTKQPEKSGDRRDDPMKKQAPGKHDEGETSTKSGQSGQRKTGDQTGKNR